MPGLLGEKVVDLELPLSLADLVWQHDDGGHIVAGEGCYQELVWSEETSEQQHQVALGLESLKR